MENNNLNQNFESPKNDKKMSPILLIIGAIIIIGVGAFAGSKLTAISGKVVSGTTKLEQGSIPKENIAKGKEFGVADPGKVDTAIGVVEKGGINGEGTHKLLREGGSSQTVYMTSSVLDLDQFVGLKIQIWGETNKAQKAGWLMDVVKVKVLD